MRCPKCHYISFETGERCRNCGYDFSLAVELAPSAELPLREREDDSVAGPLADFSLRDPDDVAPLPLRPASARTADDLPLFTDGRAVAPEPRVSPPAPPRPPLSVRRATPEAVRLRPRPARKPALDEPRLDLEPLPAPVPPAWERRGRAAADPPEPAGRAARALAALVDGSLLGAIDATVFYFTLRLCDLSLAEAGSLPQAPLVGFFLLLNGGYVAAFTAFGGQTIGKMVARIRVVGAGGAPPDLGAAVFRTAAYAASVLPAGLGFLPAFFGVERRALHDRLADTRVVKVAR